MKIQPIFAHTNFCNSGVKKNNRIAFKSQDSIETPEKTLSVKERNALLVSQYYYDMLLSIGCFPKVIGNGKFQLDNYESADKTVLFRMFGIKEQNLFSSIEVIKGEADLRGSKMTNLGALRKVGTLYLQGSNVHDISDLKEVNGDIFLNNKIKHIGNVKISGKVHLGNDSKIDIKELERNKIRYQKHKRPFG